MRFLEELKDQLSERTYSNYDNVLYYFETSLNGYAYQYLDENESKLFDKYYIKENKEFCEIFGPDKIDSMAVKEFMDYFMIKKVMTSPSFMKSVVRVIKKFVKWLRIQKYIDDVEFEDILLSVDMLKDDLPNVKKLADMISDYSSDIPIDDVSDKRNGYFKVSRISKGELWLKEMGGSSIIGPVLVNNEISSLCEEGWMISLEIGKTKNGWSILNSGNVYP